MADLHIEDFYRDVAKIFAHLYASFPRKIILYVEDISGPDEPDEFGLHNPRFQACFSTMIWLAEHGYLSFSDTIAQEALDQTVLTQKTFLLLTAPSSLQLVEEPADQSAPPSVSRTMHTNIAQLRGALRSQSSIQIGRCVSYLLERTTVA